jgi:hypothetical protein
MRLVSDLISPCRNQNCRFSRPFQGAWTFHSGVFSMQFRRTTRGDVRSKGVPGSAMVWERVLRSRCQFAPFDFQLVVCPSSPLRYETLVLETNPSEWLVCPLGGKMDENSLPGPSTSEPCSESLPLIQTIDLVPSPFRPTLCKLKHFTRVVPFNWNR